MTDRGRGRPPIGDRVSVRFPPETQARIDALAVEHDVPRAEMIRRLVEQALKPKPRKR